MSKHKNKRIDEPFVEKSVRKYLREKEGYFDDGIERELWEHGVDIKMKHKDYGRYYLVECKGEPGARGPVKAFGGSVSSSVNSAIGQIISRMHTNKKSRYGGYLFGVAFPESFRKKVIRVIPHYVCRHIRLRIFFVDQEGNTDCIQWPKLKELQRLAKIGV